MSRAALSLLILAVMPGVVSTAPSLKDKEVTYYPTTVGTRWVFRCGDQEEIEVVTKVETGDDGTRVHVAQVQAGGTEKPIMVVLVNSKGLFLLEELGKPYDAPLCILKLPAVPGEQWEATTQQPDIGQMTHLNKTGKPEQLTLPAGEFTVIPVAVTHHRGPGKGASYVYSYAPGIGCARVVTGGKTIRELKSFTPGKR